MYYNSKYLEYKQKRQVSELLGKRLLSIEVNDKKESILFKCLDGTEYLMCHDQNCCETVTIEDINGDLEDLIGSPLTMVEEVVSSEKTEDQLAKEAKEKEEQGDNYYDWNDSFTWTFYKFATVKGYVTIRWYGESNGYYSESVDFYRL
jgi:hypothetical protein